MNGTFCCQLNQVRYQGNAPKVYIIIKRLVKWLIRHGIPMNRRAKLWYEYSGAASEQKSEPELFSLLIWKEAQDLQSGYSTTTNQVLSFVEMIDQGT